jgi:hypothetical protein
MKKHLVPLLFYLLVLPTAVFFLGCDGQAQWSPDTRNEPEEGYAGAGAAEKYVPVQNAQNYFERGEMFSSQGDYVTATEEFTEAIRIDPNYAAAYNDQGIVDCTQAIRLYPHPYGGQILVMTVGKTARGKNSIFF